MIFQKGHNYGCQGEVNEARERLRLQMEFRDERKAMREAERESHEAENVKREAEAKIEHKKRKAERKRREAEKNLSAKS